MYDKFKHELPYRLLDTSKYPPEVAGRFNSFITTQFDDSLSVEMQMRSIIKWATDNFKLMDSEYNDFTDYIISGNINPFIEMLNDLIEYMNSFISEIDNRLSENIGDILNDWLTDGTLADIINEDVFDMKADKTFVDSEIERLDQKDENLTAQLAQKAQQTLIDEQAVNVSLFGALGDGVTDDRQAIINAINYAKIKNYPLYFPPTDSFYYVSSEINISDFEHIKFFSNGGRFEGRVFIIENAESVEIFGFNFKGTEFTQNLFTLPITIYDSNNINVHGNTFDSCFLRIRSRNYLNYNHGVTVYKNRFIGDVLGAKTNSGANLVEVYGYKDIDISFNEMLTDNLYRHIKTSASLDLTAGQENVKEFGFVDNLSITNNIFRGSASQQVIDTFSGVDNLTISNNLFDVHDSTTLLETKIASGTLTLTQATLKNITINNNTIIINDNHGFSSAMFRVSSFKNTQLDYAATANALFTNNKVINHSNDIVELVSFRGFTNVNCSDNIYSADKKLVGLEGRAISFLAVENILASNNSIDVGYLLISSKTSTTNSNISYNGSTKNITMVNNSVRDIRGVGGIFINDCDDIDNIVILGGVLESVQAIDSGVLGQVVIRDSVCDTVTVTGVNGYIDVNARNRVLLQNTNVNHFTDNSNSWNPSISYAKNDSELPVGVRGDIVYNSLPHINSYLGWVCVTEGEWVGFGLIADSE